MTPTQQGKMDRAMMLRGELFRLANDYAGEETGHVAVMLHEACNCIVRAEERLYSGRSKDTTVEDAMLFLKNHIPPGSHIKLSLEPDASKADVERVLCDVVDVLPEDVKINVK